MKKSRQYYMVLLLMFATPIALCNLTKWKINHEKSNITFTAIQNNAPTSGTFKAFNGEIQFDPKNLSDSSVKIIVNMTSLNTQYEDLQDTLITDEWFAIKKFPTAVFESTKFSNVKDNQYKVEGKLTIRDKTLPVTLTFNLKEYTNTTAIAQGSTTIKRILFGVGQGEWASTDEIKNDVAVSFTIDADVIQIKGSSLE